MPNGMSEKTRNQHPWKIRKRHFSFAWNAKALRENNLSIFATRFAADLDGTIEEKPRHRRTMLRVF